MLHAPVNEAKSQDGQAKRPQIPLPERERYPLSVEIWGHPSLMGNGGSSILPSVATRSRSPMGSLQRLYGNQAVLQMRGGPGGQILPLTLLRPSQSGLLLQRKCACGGAAGISGECQECSKKHQTLQRSSLSPNGKGTEDEKAVPPIVHEVLRSPGRPLDAATSAFMEPRFGHDFSHVRVHSDSQATESARAVNALAYTVGRDIVFGVGQYAPHTSAGQHLLAHELAHAVQQGGNARTLQQNSKLGEENDRYEQEAERSATQCMSGAQVQAPSMISSPLIQRTKVCSKRLEAPVLGWFFNHSYIDDTGSDNCLGKNMVGNYAIQALVSGNFLKGCAIKTATSTDPQDYTPNVKQCDPKPGVKNLSKCLRDAYNSYADPSLYKNPFGPNSNTFAATLAKTCCADGSSKGLGWVPGWNHDPAPPCVFEAGVEESPKEETAT